MGTRIGTNTEKKILALDGLRGVAILMVLVFHFVNWSSERALTGLRLVTGAGSIGVDLFFVLSGFLITGILSDARGSDGFFTNFYARRALRIFPLYYVMVALSAVLAPLLFPGNSKLAEVGSQQVWLWTYTVNVRTAIANQWTFYGMNHFWSLAVEEQFYLLWPFLVAVLPRERMARLCLVLGGVALALRLLLTLKGYWLGAYTLTPCRMDELAAGGFAALALRGTSSAEALLVQARRVAAISLLPCVLFLIPPVADLIPLAGVWRPTVLAIFFASLLLLAVLESPRHLLRKFLELSVLRLFGRYSYGLYVLHHPLRQLFEKIAPPARLAGRLHSPALAAFGFTVVSGFVSLALAATSFHLFEARLLAFKRRYEYRAAERSN